MKTSELTGAALDWAVATIHPQCKGLNFSVVDGVMCGIDPEDGTICIYMVEGIINRMRQRRKHGFSEAIAFNPSTNWAQGGPIIEREKIRLDTTWNFEDGNWSARIDSVGGWWQGDTPLIAAMRCYVVSKLGDEIEIPKELQ